MFCFSSRRRHTRWTGDWSSDVCSSDLGSCMKSKAELSLQWISCKTPCPDADAATTDRIRSEERRVGKERRSRRSRYHEKKKSAISLQNTCLGYSATCTLGDHRQVRPGP